MEPSKTQPFADLLGLVPLGRFEVPAFPWPWWCWAVAFDGGLIHKPGLAVPGLLLLPAYHWGLDADLLLRWAAGEEAGPEDKLLATLIAPKVPGWERTPRVFSLPSALQNFLDQTEAAREIGGEREAGLRKVARSRPWAFTTGPLLDLADGQLGTSPEGDWLDRAEVALSAALALPTGRGRPAGYQMDRTQSLREEVGWLRERVGRGRAFAEELERLVLLHGDRDEWPTRGRDEERGDLNRLRDVLHKTRRRIRRAGGVPVLVPHVDGAWPRSAPPGWAEGEQGGPEHAGLMRWAGGAWFAQLLRVVVGGSFSAFTSMGLIRPGGFEWASEVVAVPVRPPEQPPPQCCRRHPDRAVTSAGFGSAWCRECWSSLSTQALDGFLPGWDRHGQDVEVVGHRCLLHADRRASFRALGQHWCADCEVHRARPILGKLGPSSA